MSDGSDQVERLCIVYGIGGGHRIEQELRHSAGSHALVGFTLELQISLQDEWWPVERMRAEGGTVYLELFGKMRRSPIPPGNAWAQYGDINDAYDSALRWIQDQGNWETHVRRYLIG